MRTLLGRAAAITVASCSMVVGTSIIVGAPVVHADDATTTTTPTTASPPSSAPTTTTPTDPVQVETPSTSSSSTTTTMPSPLVVEVPNPQVATPTRGTQVQVAPTQPPPPTTTTTTLPPENLLPANSGSGRRVVYRKSWPMRVWLVEADGSVAKTHLVSGRATWNQPKIGTYSVFSRSGYTCNINNPNLCWRYMVRFTKGPEGDNIGFHEIPTDNRTGYRVQSESQLGLALSGGCVRQRTSDAIWTWNFAGIGTKVVVLP